MSLPNPPSRPAASRIGPATGVNSPPPTMAPPGYAPPPVGPPAPIARKSQLPIRIGLAVAFVAACLTAVPIAMAAESMNDLSFAVPLGFINGGLAFGVTYAIVTAVQRVYGSNRM